MEATFLNASGGLTFSGDGITYSYIGQAAFLSLSQMYYDNASSSNRGGFSTYSIYWRGDILVVLPVNSAGISIVKSLGFDSANNKWTIEVYCGNGQQSSFGYETQVQATVHVFGAPTLESIGGAQFTLYDPNGNPCADLMRRPLTTKGLLYMPSGVMAVACPAGPVGILGACGDYYYEYPSDQGGYTAVYKCRGWHYNAGTGQIERKLLTYQSLRTQIPKSTFDSNPAASAIFVDLNGL